MIDVFVLDYQDIDNCLLSVYLQTDRKKLNLYIVVPTGKKVDCALIDVLSPKILEFDDYQDRDALYKFCVSNSKGNYIVFLNHNCIFYDKYVTASIIRLMSRCDLLLANAYTNDDNSSYPLAHRMSVFGNCYRRTAVKSHLFDFIIHDYSKWRVKEVERDFFYFYY